MTKEYALHLLNQLQIGASVDAKPIIPQYEFAQALGVAIKALEAQPSEDCIKRQAVLDVINFEDEWLFDAKSHNADTKIAFSTIKYKISELPSVFPQIQSNSNEFFNFDAPMVKNSEAVSREAVIRLVEQYPNIIGNRCSGLISDIKHLPSVTPQRPKGKWIFREDMGHQYCCSECGCPKPYVNDYYYKKIIGCPYCLADMSGGGEDG